MSYRRRAAFSHQLASRAEEVGGEADSHSRGAECLCQRPTRGLHPSPDGGFQTVGEGAEQVVYLVESEGNFKSCARRIP